VNQVVGRLEARGVFQRQTGEDVARYVRERLHSVWRPPPAVSPGRPVIWKRSRRVHWAVLSLMVGFFRHLEDKITSQPMAQPFLVANLDPAWLPVGQSPPDLTGKTAADPEWRNYLTYYGLIYMAYNTKPSVWRALVTSAQQDRPLGSPLTLRDFLVFRHRRNAEVIDHVVRFVVGLDAFLRIDALDGHAPAAYAGVMPDVTDPATRAWGV
jgi:hypothetical protein